MSIQTIVISSIFRNEKIINDEAASAPITGSFRKIVEDVPKITVVLDGVIYDAEVLPYIESRKSAALAPEYITLLEGDYTLTVAPCVLPGSHTTMRTDMAGDNVVSTVTLSEPTAVNFSGQKLQPDLLTNATRYSLLAEPRSAWIPQSTRKQSSRRATMTVSHASGRIVLPSNIVLTPRVMLAVLAKMPTTQIEETVEGLLLVLDRRSGDPDLEVDADFEAEVNEDNIQSISHCVR